MNNITDTDRLNFLEKIHADIQYRGYFVHENYFESWEIIGTSKDFEDIHIEGAPDQSLREVIDNLIAEPPDRSGY